MRARVVIGANFGDEGKGLVTDYLCATQGAGVVVRFNGGAQAGHTVVTPSGQRHVFSHIGCGTFSKVPTFLSQFFVCNPLLFLKEIDALSKLAIKPVVYAHPNCLVTTFADMIINQRLEKARGANRHGSVGVGVNETIERSQIPELKITMSDAWNRIDITDRLVQICDKYTRFRTGKQIPDAEKMISTFTALFQTEFANNIHPLGISQCKDPVFEGAQGLLLDQDNKTYFPHVTRSNTGMKNVRLLCEQAGIKNIETYYVSRTYLTRHGAGPLPNEKSNWSFEDKTNIDHPFQGPLRFAPLNVEDLLVRCTEDNNKEPFKLVMTHCDQLDISCASATLAFSGPTFKDITKQKELLPI